MLCVVLAEGAGADEGALVAGPDITAGQLARQVNVEVGFQTNFVVDAFVVGAHFQKVYRYHLGGAQSWPTVSIAT